MPAQENIIQYRENFTLGENCTKLITHISALVVIGLPEYKSTISGDLYDKVVYFSISS